MLKTTVQSCATSEGVRICAAYDLLDNWLLETKAPTITGHIVTGIALDLQITMQADKVDFFPSAAYLTQDQLNEIVKSVGLKMAILLREETAKALGIDLTVPVR